MPERLDARPILGAIGGVLLLIALSLDWYATPLVPNVANETPVGNAWAVFESLDLVLAICGATAIYIAYEQLTGRFRLGERWLLPVGLLALVIVASQLIDPPPSVPVPEPLLKTGAWLALAGSASMAVAGLLSVASVSMAIVLDSDSGSRGSPRPSRRRATAEE
jgi:hypothetical protein